MGTVFNQLPRMDNLSNDRIINLAKDISKIAKEAGITYIEALETYKTVALISDYDTKDEQIAGIAELLQKLVYVLEELNNRDDE